MTILEKLGRQTIRLGSHPDCELRLDERGVAPFHAEIVHSGQGRLLFIPGNAGPCYQNGQRLQAAVPVPFDFQSRFFLDQTEVPLTHEAICLMVMRRGLLPPDPHQLVIGRDPDRAHLVLTSPGVSAKHATLTLPELQFVDHHSTSGSWYQGERLPEETPVPLAADALVAIGPLPLPLPLAQELHQAFQKQERAPASGATLAMQQTPHPQAAGVIPTEPRARHRTLMGTVRMEIARHFSIGRTPDNDIVLDHPQVSSKHAKLLSISEQLFLEDQGSEQGTSVRGIRLQSGQRIPVQDGERILFGPMPTLLRIRGEVVELLVEDRAGWQGKPLFEIEARHLRVEVPDRDAPRQKKTLLDDVSFQASPGDFIALMGPSGSGKTTLLHLLTGYRTPSSGEILMNGEPFSTVFPTLRGSIGYVPQDDIIHPELTVWEAVHYSARFRLPADYSEEEITERVQTTLEQLGLDGVAHLQIGKPEAKVLSGGQRKRVNIALELVTDPVLLFLDEPTSGLAADDTTHLIDRLASLARTTGKTIIATIHQPARAEYEKFNLSLILGQGGVPIYFGPTRDAYGFFESWRAPSERSGVETPRDMFAELTEREARLASASPGLSRDEVRALVAQSFRQEYEASSIFEQLQTTHKEQRKSLASFTPTPVAPAPRGHLGLLLNRYLRVKWRDRVGTFILFAQAPLIGVLLALVFGHQKQSVPFWCLGALEELARRGEHLAKGAEGILSRMSATADHSAALFFVVVAAVWFGTSNAAREIVSERAIYQRERRVHLGIGEYVLSKFLVLSAFSILQSAILLLIIFFSLGLSGGAEGFFTALGMLSLTAVCSVALGLLLSAVVSSSEAAMALTPLALIPQVVLGGLMVPVTTVPWLAWPARFIPARWGFEGVIRVERMAQADHPAWRIELPGVPESPPDYIVGSAFRCAEAQLKSHDFLGAWGFSTAERPAIAAFALCGMTLLCLSAVMLRLARNDRPS